MHALYTSIIHTSTFQKYSMYKLYPMGRPIIIIMTDFQIKYSAFPDNRNQW